MTRMNAHVLCRVVVVVAACALPLSLAAQASPSRPAARPAAKAVIDGAKLFGEHCAACHGKKGEGTPMGRPLAAPLMNGESVEAITEILETGVVGTPMMSFSKKLPAAQIEALAKYVAAMKR